MYLEHKNDNIKQKNMGRIKFTLPQRLVTSIINHAKPNNFIEIGSSDEQVLVWASSRFKNTFGVITNADNTLKIEQNNVKLIQADQFSDILKGLNGQSVFFINNLPVNKTDKVPSISISEELNIISQTENPIIFINNADYLGGPIPYTDKLEGWPTLDEILTLCKTLFSDAYLTLVDGNIICVPQNLKNIVETYWVETFEERFYESDPEPPRRSLFERIISRSKRIIKQKTTKKEPVAYNIRESVWFENQKILFRDSHRWMLEYQFKSIIDIGANVGQFGKKIRQYYPEAHLYSFEPIPFVCEELKLNFKGDTNFTAINAGVGDRDGNAKFHMNLFSDSSSMLEIAELHTKNFPYTKDEIEIDVEIKRLDSCFKATEIQKPYLVKIDVQGFEEQVIDGGLQVIGDAEMVITEASYKELYKGQSLFDALYEKLKALGFEYIGNLDQMESAFTGEPLQGDAIFVKKK